MSITYDGITIDGADLQLLALDAYGPTKTIDPFSEETEMEAFQRELRAAKSAGVKRRYEAGVLALLRSIGGTRTGGAVFKEIRRQGSVFGIEIRPWLIDSYWEKEIARLKKQLRENPGILPEYYKASIRKCEKRAMAEEPNASAEGIGRGNQPDRSGRAGKREKALVRFTPANWMPTSIHPELGIGVPFRGPGSEPDEVLLHELVHALRIAAGLEKSKRRVPYQKQYDSMEEFFAILVTNIYRSECRRKFIRSGHEKYYWFKSADAAAFLDEGMNRLHLRQLRFQQPQLFNDLNDVNVPFNPLRGFRDARV